MFIDSHCHLNHRKSAADANTLVARANDAGVAGMVTICCRMAEEVDQLKAICDANKNVWMTVGTHPHDASEEAEKKFTTDDFIAMSKTHNKIVGIGECGLDYHYNFGEPADQAEGFRRQIRACIETKLPIIVHARDADQDIIRIIKEETAGGQKLTGVMHCFSSSPWMADEALALGFYLSFSGIVTFKNGDELRGICKRAPKNRILIETDAPYLAPEPHRKVTNEPALVIHTANVVAEAHDLTRDEIGKITADNFFDLFPKARETWQPA